MILNEIVNEIADAIHRSIIREEHPNATSVIVNPDTTKYPGWSPVQLKVSITRHGSKFTIELSCPYGFDGPSWKKASYEYASDIRVINMDYSVLMNLAYMMARTTIVYVDKEIERYVNNPHKED